MAEEPALARKVDALADTLARMFETIGQRFDAVDQRFDAVDQRFDAVDQRFDEQKAHLRIEVEAVDAKLDLAMEKIDDLIHATAVNRVDHQGFERQLDDHEIRIRSLESERGRNRPR